MTRPTQIVVRCSPKERARWKAQAKAWAKSHAADITPERALSAYLRALIAANAEVG